MNMGSSWKIFFSPLLFIAVRNSCAFAPGHIKITRSNDRKAVKLSTKNDGIIETKPSVQAPKIDYDWKNMWYPVTYSEYVLHPKKSAEAVAASIFDHPLVLWRDESGILHCADDVCPHRAAALSEGQVIGGKLECLYHGWQFQGNRGGDCVTIPQLEENASIPKRACLKMRPVKDVEGIVCVWMGDKFANDAAVPLSGNALDSDESKKKYGLYDFQIDLPYDHSYLIENLLDPAHIPISHDATSGGGKRENAQAFKMEVDKDSFSSKGFTGRYSFTKTKGLPNEVKFEAPGIIRSRAGNGNIEFNADLHCIPLGLGRSRLLFRVYFAGLPRFARLLVNAKPKWLRHLNSCKVLEQDIGLITTQEDHFAQTGRNLKDDFLLLDSSDALLGAYRKWMDRVGHGMPWFQGLAAASVAQRSAASNHELRPGLDPMGQRSSGYLETRYHRHVVHCPATRNALKRVKICKRISFVLAVVAFHANTNLATAMMVPKFLKPIRLLAPTSALIFGSMHLLEKEFYTSFKRRSQLRNKKGA